MRCKQIIPDDIFLGIPCSMVACGCADRNGVRERRDVEKYRSPELRETDGYLSLDGFNRLCRKYFHVQKKIYFRRTERPLLEDYIKTLDQPAFICVYGHLIYADPYADNGKGGYMSFFLNDNDPVVCVWLLKPDNSGHITRQEQ